VRSPTESGGSVRDHHDVLARRDDVVASVLGAGDDVDAAVALLDRAEETLEIPLVDEAERERLRGLADDPDGRTLHWHPVLARRDGAAVGYAGVVLPAQPGGEAVGDIAVDRDHGPCGPVLASLLASLERLAWSHTAGHLAVWIRHAQPHDITCATDEGYGVVRRLGVLGRDLRRGGPWHRSDRRPSPPPAAGDRGVTVRAYEPGRDDAAVVEVLAAAYEGTADDGWTLERFAERRTLPWFRAEDLLLAVDDVDGRALGLHWLKRRDAHTGEVYNLAIHPAGQGRGLGATLLSAGLDHLVSIGCTDVLLWVDLANERAVRLYTSHGFATRWEDVALGRTLFGTGEVA
jgi:mycothiol synthase